MKILLDAMGGDNAPDANIKGAVKAINQIKAEVILIGKQKSKRILWKNSAGNITKTYNKKCNRNNRNGRWTNR